MHIINAQYVIHEAHDPKAFLNILVDSSLNSRLYESNNNRLIRKSFLSPLPKAKTYHTQGIDKFLTISNSVD